MHSPDQQARTTPATADEIRLLALIQQYSYWNHLLATCRHALYTFDDLTDMAEDQVSPRLIRELNMSYTPLRETIQLCNHRLQI